MNAMRNDNGAIMAITDQNVTAGMALRYRDIIITAVRSSNKDVVDVNEKESWERLKIHPVPLIGNMKKGTNDLPKMREEFEGHNEGISIPTQVR
jgi:hypothetical protein